MQRVLKLSWIAPLLAAAWIVNSGFTPPYRADHKLPGLSAKEADVFSLRSLKNWGLSNSQAHSHISAPDAWKIEEGKRDVVVAVIDTGLDANHPDLAKNVWHDPALKNRGVYGWNYVNDRPNPSDEHGHGTHVAGIIGAVSNPKTGVSGVAHRVSIMAVKYYSDSNPGPVNLRNTVRALNYAIDHGAKVINYSGGGPEFSEDEYLAMKRAEAKGVLVVSAAGNEHQNTDLTGNAYYPAAYRLSNMISVASTDIHNNLLGSSNWGKQNVDVAAPGENIFSTLPGGKYGSMSGTSQATAFVSARPPRTYRRENLPPASARLEPRHEDQSTPLPTVRGSGPAGVTVLQSAVPSWPLAEDAPDHACPRRKANRHHRPTGQDSGLHRRRNPATRNARRVRAPRDREVAGQGVRLREEGHRR
jgi:subtilisin family serine protease